MKKPGVSSAALTDEELDAAITAVESEDDNQDAATPEGETSPGDKPDKGTPSVSDGSVEPAKADNPGETLDPAKELASVKAELQHLRKAYGRQSNELGELRRRVQQEEKELADAEPTEADFADNPKAATKKQKEVDERKAKLESEKVRLAAIETHQTLVGAIPTFVEDFPDAVKTLAEEDGAPADLLAAFQANPYQMGATSLYHLTKRAQVRRELTKAQTRIKELETELKEAKKAPSKMVERINAGQRNFQAPTSRASGGKHVATGELTPAQAAKLSDEEIERRLAESEE